MTRLLILTLVIAGNLAASDHLLKITPETVAWGYYWSAAKPVLTVKSGDTVTVECVSVGNPSTLEAAGLPADQVEADIRRLYAEVPKDKKGPGGHPLTGPIAIEGAMPGDVLEVRIKEIRLRSAYAFNSFGPGRGFLPDDFTTRKTRIIPLDREKMVGHFAPGIDVPLRPFFGSMGIAPPESAGKISSAPPGIHAGNMDNKDLVAGTTLFIPVHAAGALFEVGDGHAGQGNGEVDITAMETSLTGVFQFILHKDMHLKWPRAETPTHYITMGIDKDLTAAAKICVRETLDFLVSEKKMAREDAYQLSSIAVDFNITQLVDGTVGVHGMIPKSIFVGTK
jgi:acetamidase/formamidase